MKRALISIALTLLPCTQARSGDELGLAYQDSAASLAPDFQLFKKKERKPPPPRAWEVDLRAQFPERKAPDQGKVGSCHAFAAVGLLEAAYFRHSGRPIAFSEVDLFAQSKICTGDICSEGYLYKSEDRKHRYMLGEGGFPHLDLKFMLQNGVLPDGICCTRYSGFHDGYRWGMQRQLKENLGVKSVAFGKKMNPVQFSEFLEKEAARYAGYSPSADGLRDAVRQELRGFHILHSDYPKLEYKELYDMSGGWCRKRGKEQKEKLLNILNQGRPAAVGMDLVGLRAWGLEWSSSEDPPGYTDPHAFLVVGYADDSGGIVFKTRNSWMDTKRENGGFVDFPVNPDVFEKDLCRVFDITDLMTPEEYADLLTPVEYKGAWK